jgi:hypothetical protein
MPKVPTVKKYQKGVPKAVKDRAAAWLRRRIAKRQIQITVVDKHHHVLKPIWDAVAAGSLPKSGVKLLHFDSHPDMGVFGDETAPGKPDYKEIVKVTAGIFRNEFNKELALKHHDIATWVPTLVAQGLVDEVIWVCGWWCKQFGNGTLELFVGKSKIDGRMRVAFPDDSKSLAYDYWRKSLASDKLENLTDLKPWKMHVVKFAAGSCKLPQEGLDQIVRICSGQPWILDIDEDYVSTQNPFAVSFQQHYGDPMYQKLVEIYDMPVSDDDRYCVSLETIVKKSLFQKSPAAFAKEQAVKDAVEDLRGGGVSARKATAIMAEYRQMCRKMLPPRALCSDGKPDEDPLHEREIMKWDDVTGAAMLSFLPHHISSLNEIVALLQHTRDLFYSIRTQPGVVTVATSRYDEYTPEPQAATINCLTLDMLTDTWERTRVIRRDFRSSLSVEDRYDPRMPDPLALFLSRGKTHKFPSGSPMKPFE